MAGLSHTPFDCSLHSQPLSPHAGTAFGWCCQQPALKGEVGFALAKAGGVASWLLLFSSTPQSIRLAAYCQLPVRGAFWCALQTPAQLRRAANDGPYSAHYKPLAKTRGRTASPQLHNLLRSPAVRRISHGGAIFHCALAQFHPFARTDFTAGVSPLISFPLPLRWLRRGSR